MIKINYSGIFDKAKPVERKMNLVLPLNYTVTNDTGEILITLKSNMISLMLKRC
jgi:hypothetical protein